MKTTLLSILLGLTVKATAQPVSVETIKITGTKFPFSIMQQWINEFTKSHPEIKFELSKSIAPDDADLLIAAHAFRPGELKGDQIIVAVNRYAQLPIVNSNRPDLEALQACGFTNYQLAAVFFSEEDKKTDEFNYPVTIYRRDKNVCATRSFSENILGSQRDIYGVNVNGDDRALSAAVRSDLNGLSYNSLGIVYNVETRKISDSIAVVPFDFNANGVIDENEKIYATLDEVLDFIANTGTNKIPQDNVNIVFNKTRISRNALLFLDWIITEGRQYNRFFGFLDLDKAVAWKQRAFLTTMLSDNNSAAIK